MNKFITFLFAILFTIWTIRLYYKLYDKKTRRYILLIGLLIVFWMLIRIIKGIAVSPLTERMCWYLYYLPLIFIPTLYYISSLSLLGKMNKTKKKIIYSISCFLLLLVLTNDFHELVFKFVKGIVLFDDYKHFIGYYLILLGLTYTIIYVLNVPYVRGINMSIVNSALICVGIELAFYLNLIPNNSKYKSRFSNSNLNMAIISLDGKTKYTTNVFDNIPKKLLDDINNNSVKETYKNKNIIYDIKKNKDSYVILKKDLSSILELEKEINEQKKELLEQQESIRLEEKTKKELYEMQIRKDVIDKVELKLTEKRNEIKKILKKKDVSTKDFEKVKRIIIYSKKKSMLIISEINGDSYNENGIKALLDELLNSMKSANIKSFISINNKMIINGNTMSLLYDIVYELIESSNDKSIVLFISKENKNVKLKAIIDTDKSLKNKIKIDSSVLIKEKIYDTDTELEFVIKGGVIK